jgi:hypothetical protein
MKLKVAQHNILGHTFELALRDIAIRNEASARRALTNRICASAAMS